jgi:hypothetical protein
MLHGFFVFYKACRASTEPQRRHPRVYPCVHSAVLLGHDRGAAPRVLCRDRRPFGGTARRQTSVTVTMALRELPESSRSGFAGPNWDPGLEIEVPLSKDR